MKKISVYVMTTILLICSVFLLISCDKNDSGGPTEENIPGNKICQHEFELTREVPATCTNPGFNEYTCKLCHEKKTEITTPKLGHEGQWVLVEQPTCYKDGVEERICSRCGEKHLRAVKSLAHNYVEDKSQYVAPTCTENGKRVYKCANPGCNESYEVAVFATGHTPVDAGVVKKATCTERGYTTFKCSVCGEEYIDDIVEPYGHNMVIDKVTEQTCESGKSTVYKCSHEGCTHTEYKYESQRTNHEFINGECKHCHKKASQVFPFMTESPDNDVFIYKNGEDYRVTAKSLILSQYPFRSELYHTIIIGREVIDQLVKDGYSTAIINLSHIDKKYMQFWYMTPGATEWRAFNSWAPVPVIIKFADDNGVIDNNVVTDKGVELKVYYFNFGDDTTNEGPTWDDVTTEYKLDISYKKTIFIPDDKLTWIDTQIGFKMDAKNEFYLFDGGKGNLQADSITILPATLKYMADSGYKSIEVAIRPKENQLTIFAVTGDGINGKHEQNTQEGTPIKITITDEMLSKGIKLSIFYSQWGPADVYEDTSGYRMRLKGI